MWVREYLDEVIADGWCYYGCDITCFPAHRVFRLAEMLPDLWDLLETDPPRWRSAIAAAQHRYREANKPVASGSELLGLGIGFTEVKKCPTPS
jgi:hypothetical protein